MSNSEQLNSDNIIKVPSTIYDNNSSLSKDFNFSQHLNSEEKPENIITQNLTLSIRGQQFCLLKILCNKASKKDPHITCQIDLDFLSNTLKLKKDIVKMNIKRLVKKGYISRYESEKGRTGWTKYLIKKESFDYVIKESKPISSIELKEQKQKFKLVDVIQKENNTFKKDNQLLKQENNKRKFENFEIKDKLEKTNKRLKRLESEIKRRDKYFGKNLPLCLPPNVDLNDLDHLRTIVIKKEIPNYVFIEGSFKKSKVHAINVIDILLKDVKAFKIGITNDVMDRYRKGYAMCGSFLVLFKSDYWETVKIMETELIEHYKPNPKCKNKNPGGEGNESINGGPYYTYIASKFKQQGEDSNTDEEF